MCFLLVEVEGGGALDKRVVCGMRLFVVLHKYKISSVISVHCLAMAAV